MLEHFKGGFFIENRFFCLSSGFEMCLIYILTKILIWSTTVINN